MNTTSIEAAIKLLFQGCPCIPYFVTPSNVTIKPPSYPCLYVKNTSPSSQPGQHWVGFYCLDSTHCEFFDPMGYSVQKYPRLSSPVPIVNKSNTYKLQSSYTYTCGMFVIVFLYLRAKGWTFAQIVNNFFSENVQHNEYIVKNFFRKYLPGFQPARMYEGANFVQTNICYAHCTHDTHAL